MNATIQAQAEYRSRFGNYRYKLQIVDSHQESENIRLYNITPEGAVIQYEVQDQNVFQPIIPSTCRFTLVCETLAEVAFLRAVARSESGRYGVRVLRADNNGTPTSVYWLGTLISDQFNFNDRLPLHVDFLASDDLGYLKDIPYTQSNGERFTGQQTVTEHILNCLNLLRTKWHWGYFVTILGTDFYNGMLQYSDDIRSNTFAGSGTTGNIFDYTKIRHMAFYTDNEQRVENAYNVLKDLLLFFNCQLYFTYSTNFVSFIVRPFGSYQKYAEDGTALQNGKFVRANNVNFTVYQSNLSTLDIGSTTDSRKQGGSFSYLQPYKKVTRKNNREDNTESIFNKSFEEEQNGTLLNGLTMSDGNENASVYKIDQTYNLTTLTGLEVGEQFKVRLDLLVYFNASVATDYPTLVHSTASGFSGTMPEAFNIFRIRVKLQFRLSNSDGNDHYLKRELTTGGQVPVYANFSGFSSTPQYYTDEYEIENGTWDTSGSVKEVHFISAPFDGNVSQNVTFSNDFITPEIGTFGSGEHEGTKVKVEVDLVAYDGTILSVATSGNNYLFEDSHNHNVSARVRINNFNGYDSSNLQTFTSVNDIDARKTLNAESPKHIGDYSSMFASPQYLHSTGQYVVEGGGYISANETTSVFPAAKLCAEEIAAYYSRHREKYEGTLIKVVPTFSTVVTYDNSLVGGGTDTIKCKVQKIRYITGIEEADVTLIELDRDKHLTSMESNVKKDDDGGYIPPPDPPLPPISGLESALVSNMGVVVAPSVDVTAAAVARNRSGQTGQLLAAIDANGVLQEIDDGSNGHILSTNGSGVYSFGAQSFMYMLASHSFMGTLSREDYYYYGSNFYGFSSFAVNSSASGISSINDQYAHNGIVVPYGFSRLVFKSTIRNDSNANDIDVTILKGARPNGSSSNITLTSLGTGSANNDAGVDLHYNCDIDITGLSITAGELIFVVFKRADGGAVTTNINVSYSLLAIT